MPIKIAVLLKQVPDCSKTSPVIFNDDGSIRRSELPSICNPSDLKALEMALKLKDTIGEHCHVTALSMGPLSAEAVIKTALYRGASDGILISDRFFAGSDTLATSRILFSALQSISPDIIFAGSATIDGGTSQVGPQVAELSGILDFYSVMGLSYQSKDRFRIDCKESEIIARPPFLIAVSDSAPKCREENIRLYMKYKHSQVKVLSAEDLGFCEPVRSMTCIDSVFPPETEKKQRITLGLSDENIDFLIKRIMQ